MTIVCGGSNGLRVLNACQCDERAEERAANPAVFDQPEEDSPAILTFPSHFAPSEHDAPRSLIPLSPL